MKPFTRRFIETHPRLVRALIVALSPIDRWFGWDGRCGRALHEVWICGLPARCANPVSRITYVVAGRCLRRH